MEDTIACTQKSVIAMQKDIVLIILDDTTNTIPVGDESLLDDFAAKEGD